MIHPTPHPFRCSEEGFVTEQDIKDLLRQYGEGHEEISARIIHSRPGELFILGEEPDTIKIVKLESPMYKDDNGDFRTEEEYKDDIYSGQNPYAEE